MQWPSKLYLRYFWVIWSTIRQVILHQSLEPLQSFQWSTCCRRYELSTSSQTRWMGHVQAGRAEIPCFRKYFTSTAIDRPPSFSSERMFILCCNWHKRSRNRHTEYLQIFHSMFGRCEWSPRESFHMGMDGCSSLSARQMLWLQNITLCQK